MYIQHYSKVLLSVRSSVAPRIPFLSSMPCIDRQQTGIEKRNIAVRQVTCCMLSHETDQLWINVSILDYTVPT